jgi:hypothetical protein
MNIQHSPERDCFECRSLVAVDESLICPLCDKLCGSVLTRSDEPCREKDLTAPLERGAQEDFQYNIIKIQLDTFRSWQKDRAQP